MKNIYFFLITLALYGCFNSKPPKKELLPIVDLTKEYPKKIFLENDGDIEYIPLETNKEAFADMDFRIVYLSDKRIVGINKKRGDIFIFGRDGRIISFFNHRGNSGIEYIQIRSIAYDEENKEIFIADLPSKKNFIVFSEEGKFLRNLRLHNGLYITEIYNFDDQTLLAYNDLQPDPYNGWVAEKIDDIHIKFPYIFLSKKDGSLVSSANISFEKRFSNQHIAGFSNGIARGVTVSTNTRNVKFGQNFIIDDKSLDTVFLLTQNKKLTPLFVKTPSVFKTNQMVCYSSVHLKTDRYLFFISITYDIHETIGLAEQRKQDNIIRKDFVYDLQAREFFTPEGKKHYGTMIDAPENTNVNILEAYHLIERLEKGRLSGKLKEIAQTLKEEDNPVVSIYKFKENYDE